MAALQSLSVVDKITLDRNGILSVRLQKMRVLGDRAFGVQYHSFALMPGDDPEAIFRIVGSHLNEMGEGQPDEAGSWSKVRRWVSQFHTTEENERYHERRRRHVLREDPDADREGDVVFNLMGALYQTPASPPGRVDRVIAANPVLLLRGRANGVALGKLSVAPGQSIDSAETVSDYMRRIGLRGSVPQTLDAVFETITQSPLAKDERARIESAITCEHCR